ncbi:hypothetical protein J6590_059956 [Homalodisca vitripennis]|nr:hypothetical protein J6590_059956 [Homalodisca vitripennis]
MLHRVAPEHHSISQVRVDIGVGDSLPIKSQDYQLEKYPKQGLILKPLVIHDPSTSRYCPSQPPRTLPTM